MVAKPKKRASSKPTSKQAIISAAARIVQNAGAGHLTIDAVAAESKLSKGGVLYHFPNKRALLEGMLADLITQIEDRREAHAAKLSGANITLRSFVLAEHDLDDQERATSLAILAAAAEDPTLLDPARDRVHTWFAMVAEEASGDAMATTLLLAVEGLRFLDMLNLLPEGAAKFNQQILALAEKGS